MQLLMTTPEDPAFVLAGAHPLAGASLPEKKRFALAGTFVYTQQDLIRKTRTGSIRVSTGKLKRIRFGPSIAGMRRTASGTSPPGRSDRPP